MWSINWTALGTWASVVVIGISALIALQQFIAFNQNERVKNTLTLLAAYTTDRQEGTSHSIMTVAQAIPVITKTAKNVDAFVKGKQDYENAQETVLAAQYIMCSDALVITMNYFVIAGHLMSRKLIDAELFLGPIDAVILSVAAPMKQLLSIDIPALDFSVFDAFVAKAASHNRAHPRTGTP